jgi:tetratricopeptide (TPR) repeat protein
MGRLGNWLKYFLGENISHDPTNEAALLIGKGQIAEAEVILRQFVANPPAGWRPVIESSNSVKVASWDQSEFMGYVAHHHEDNGKEIVWISPSYSKAFYYLAFISTEKQDWQNALHYVEQGLDLEPDHPLLLCEKALILGRLKRHAEAYDLYRKAIRIRPWVSPGLKAQAMRGAGAMLADLDRLNEAEVILRESLRIEPQSENAKNELIYIEQLRNGESRTDGYYLAR